MPSHQVPQEMMPTGSSISIDEQVPEASVGHRLDRSGRDPISGEPLTTSRAITSCTVVVAEVLVGSDGTEDVPLGDDPGDLLVLHHDRAAHASIDHHLRSAPQVAGGVNGQQVPDGDVPAAASLRGIMAQSERTDNQTAGG